MTFCVNLIPPWQEKQHARWSVRAQYVNASMKRGKKPEIKLVAKRLIKGEGLFWHRASTWQGEKAPCHVWEGNNRLRGLREGKRFNLSFLRSRLCFFALLSTELLRKAADLPFLVFISGGKCPLFPHQARMKIAFVLVRCVFFSPPFFFPPQCIQTPYSSNLFASFSCVFPASLCASLFFWTVWASPEVCARPLRLKAFDSLPCVCVWSWNWVTAIFDSCVTQRTEILPPSRAEGREKKSLTSARLVPLTWIQTCLL